MKDWTTRRDQTIQFIRNAVLPGVAPGRNELVADLLQFKYPIGMVTSVGMGQIRWWHRDRRGGQESRHYRRACIAIRSKILNVGAAVGPLATLVNVIPDALLQAALATDVNAAVVAEQGLLNVAWTELTTNPLQFMGTRPLRVEGVLASGSAQWVFYYHHTDSEYRFVPATALTGGEMLIPGWAGGPQQRVPFVLRQVYHARIQDRAGILNLQLIPGDDIQHDDIVITAQLTGCSFMYQTNGADMTAIHIQPDPTAPPYSLARELRGLVPAAGGVAPPPAAFHVGAVAAAGAMNVFGAVHGTGNHAGGGANVMDYDYTNNVTHVVGVHDGVGWHVYAQARSRWAMPAPVIDHWQVS